MFQQFLTKYSAALDQEMQQVVNSFPHLSDEFKTMIRYPMGWVNADGTLYDQPTGKRIRPALLLLCAEAAGGDWQRALPAAASVEILHNFSLVHDDIQDNSDVRHNRPTVWQVWGAPMAINIGDAMFALAYHAMYRLREQNFPAEVVLDVWETFNSTIVNLTRGQYLDMSFEQRPEVTVDEYLSMVEGKTAVLLAGASRIGALLGSNDHTVAQNYAEFGLNLGLAFQIRDDILGIWGDPAQTGKSAATDIVSRKKSLPVLYGLAQSSQLRQLYDLPQFDADTVEKVVTRLDELGAKAYTQELETTYYTQAMTALEQANPTGEAATTLTALVDTLFGRGY